MSMKIIRGLLASSVMFACATPVLASDGTISFTGAITAASCKITAGAGTAVAGEAGKQIINVDLGTVSMSSLGDGSVGSGIAAGTAINLNLDCGETAAGLNTVSVLFDPMSGSGVDTFNNKLLKTVGGAVGVGIGIYNADANNTLINLSGNEKFEGDLIATGAEGAKTYTANLNLRAAYVTNGETPLVAGEANGTLPFTLSYK